MDVLEVNQKRIKVGTEHALNPRCKSLRRKGKLQGI